METARWIVGIVALAVYAVLMYALLGMAIHRLKTGQYASGLAFVPSGIAIVGILILPISALTNRMAFVIFPIAIESTYFWFNLVYDGIKGDNAKADS